MKTPSFVIIVLITSTLLAGTSNQVFAPCLVGVTSCGPPPGVTVVATTDSQFYEKNDTITVRGQVYLENYTKPVTIQVVNPNNTAIQNVNVPVTSETFGTKIAANFTKTGVYQIVTCIQNWCDRSYFKFVSEPYRLTAGSTDFLINYKSFADLVGMEADVNSHALRVHISNATAQGLQFVIELPRTLFNSKGYDNKDASFRVLIGMHQPDKYMQHANFTEIASNDKFRTLAIDIPYDPVPNSSGTWDFKIMSADVVSGPGVFSEPPLKQFKSGIKAEDVQCRQDLQLVIKSEDGSPACVKPGHLTRLSQYGWTIPNLKIISDTDIANNDGLSETNCGQFYTIPENQSNSNEMPVLILKQNSIGCAKITFTVNFLFNNTNDCVGCNSQMIKTAEFLSIGKYNFSRHGDLISGSSGKDYTNSFQIASVPKTVDVSKYPIGSNFTLVFIIKPLLNATGFYDYSIVKPVCTAYPLAVGYSPDQINSSDFSEDLSFMQNHPCGMGSYGYSKVQVSGISYVQMKLN